MQLSPSKSNLEKQGLVRNAAEQGFNLSEINIRPLHFEGEPHFCLHTAGKDLEHQFDEGLLLDDAVFVAFAGEGVEPVAHDARQVHVLHESHLVDGPMAGGLLGRTDGQVRKDARQVGSQIPLDELRVDLRVEVFHVEQVDEAGAIVSGADNLARDLNRVLRMDPCGELGALVLENLLDSCHCSLIGLFVGLHARSDRPIASSVDDRDLLGRGQSPS